MASSSSTLPRKILPFLLAASLILASFNLPVIFNKQFLKIKNTIEKESGAILGKDVKIRSIRFLPYGEMILKDIKIQDKEKDISYAEIEKLNIRFSVLGLLLSKNATGARYKKSGEFDLKGVVVFKKPVFIGPVKYKLDVIVTPDVISIGDLSLDFEKFNVDIKGNIINYAVSPKAELIITSKEIGLQGASKLNNIYSSVIISKDELIVNNLDLFVNNFPLGIRCKISDFRSPSVELSIVSYPGQLPSLRPFNPFNFELDYSGKKLGNSMSGDLTLRTQSLRSIDPREICHTMIRLDGLSCVLVNKAAFVNVKNIILETNISEKAFDINAADFKTQIYLGKTKIYFTGSSASAYKGLVKGNGFLDPSQWPPKLLLDFKVYRLDVAELTQALKLRYESKGSLDFEGVFNNKREPCLSGRLDVMDGYLKNAQVFGLISDFLSTPSLKNVYFDRISSLVSLSSAHKEVAFDKISVSSQAMNLSGNVKLKNTRKINGDISVRLSTELLKESFRLRMLFLLVGERLPYQDFEFEIGGFLNSPQIRWLSTRFKENALKYLTEGGKQAMEKALEQAIGELLPSN